VFGTTALGLVLGHYLRHRSEHLREPFGVLQAALLGLVGLVLAFGLALAVGRYESRRAGRGRGSPPGRTHERFFDQRDLAERAEDGEGDRLRRLFLAQRLWLTTSTLCPSGSRTNAP
jgi:hypothetical protein